MIVYRIMAQLRRIFGRSNRPVNQPITLSESGLIYKAYQRQCYGLTHVWIENDEERRV